MAHGHYLVAEADNKRSLLDLVSVLSIFALGVIAVKSSFLENDGEA